MPKMVGGHALHLLGEALSVRSNTMPSLNTVEESRICAKALAHATRPQKCPDEFRCEASSPNRELFEKQITSMIDKVSVVTSRHSRLPFSTVVVGKSFPKSRLQIYLQGITRKEKQ
jgi:hypothetical protein